MRTNENSQYNTEYIGLRIKDLRKAKKLSRKELAHAISCSDHYIYEIETARKTFTLDVLIRLSSYFNVTSDYILFGTLQNKTASKNDAVYSNDLRLCINYLTTVSKETLNKVASLDNHQRDIVLGYLNAMIDSYHEINQFNKNRKIT